MRRWRRRTAAKAHGPRSRTADEPAQNDALALTELTAKIDWLEAEPGLQADRDLQTQLLWLRHLAGIRTLDQAPTNPAFVVPGQAPPAGLLPVAELTRADLTPATVRAGILRDGCVLVRGLLGRSSAEQFAAEIDQAFAERERRKQGATVDERYHLEFEPHPRFGQVDSRGWIEMGGGLLAADSPRLCARMMALFRTAGVPDLVSGYLGEPALVSIHKTTLRKAEPQVGGAWHQDGFFMGPVRALNLWVALSRCGDEAPGLDLVPHRLDAYVATGTEGAELAWTISQTVVEDAAGAEGIVRPIFEPGDALLFDELCLHKTGSDPGMPHTRFAIESWFFGGSSFPPDYAPLLV